MLLAVLLFGSIGLQLVNPQIVRHIDARSAAKSVVAVCGLAFIAIALLQQVVAVAAYTGENVAADGDQHVARCTVTALRSDMRFPPTKRGG